MKKIAVIYGSSRPSKVGESVADWFMGEVEAPEGVELEAVNLGELGLPMVADPMPPMMGEYKLDSTKKWSEQVSSYDGFVVMPAEYNHSFTPILKNAFDTLYAEWGGKPLAFVSYSGDEERRAVTALMPVMETLKVSVVDKSTHISGIFDGMTKDGGLDVSKAQVGGDSPQEVLEAVC